MFVVFLVLNFMNVTLRSVLWLNRMSGARKNSQIPFLFLTVFQFRFDPTCIMLEYASVDIFYWMDSILPARSVNQLTKAMGWKVLFIGSLVYRRVTFCKKHCVCEAKALLSNTKFWKSYFDLSLLTEFPRSLFLESYDWI